jgi:hypothetical protein
MSSDNSDLMDSKLFLSARHTTMMRDYLINTYTDRCEIKTSNHSWSVEDCNELGDIKQESYDVCIFGYKIQIAFNRLFTDVDFKAHADNMGVPLPMWHINEYKYSRANKIVPLVEWLREHNTDNSNMTADNIELFTTTIQALDRRTIHDLDQWDIIVTNCNILDTYKDKLNINNVLQAFGATDETADCARIAEYTEPYGYVSSMQNKFFYELIDILSCCELTGINFDYVNLAFIMMRIDQTMIGPARNITNAEADERNVVVVNFMDEFINLILERSHEFLWMPDIIVHDFTVGNIVGWVILSYLHEARGTQLQTIVQLCPGAESLTGIITCAGAGSFIDPDANHLRNLRIDHSI